MNHWEFVGGVVVGGILTFIGIKTYEEYQKQKFIDKVLGNDLDSILNDLNEFNNF